MLKSLGGQIHLLKFLNFFLKGRAWSYIKVHFSQILSTFTKITTICGYILSPEKKCFFGVEKQPCFLSTKIQLNVAT